MIHWAWLISAFAFGVFTTLVLSVMVAKTWSNLPDKGMKGLRNVSEKDNGKTQKK
jgi:hypothetical protein